MIRKSSGVHPTGHVDGISPYVILWLPSSDDAGYNRSDVHANAQHEVIVRVIINVDQFFLHREHKLDERAHIMRCRLFVVIRNSVLWHQADRRHVSRSDRLDLIDCLETLFTQQLHITKLKCFNESALPYC